MSDDGVLINQEIADAVHMMHLLELQMRKGGTTFVVEPHAYGVTHDGHHAIWAWRVAGAGKEPTGEQGLKLIRLDEMSCARMQTETFDKPRQGYTRANRHMRLIHVQV